MIERQRFGHFPADGQRPRVGAQTAGIGGRISFIEAKFIEVIVAGDFIFRRQRELTLPSGGFIESDTAF